MYVYLLFIQTLKRKGVPIPIPDRQTDRQTGRQAARQTDRQTDTGQTKNQG